MAGQEVAPANNNSESEDDSDFDDDFLTPSETLRLEEVKTNVLRAENMRLLGYGVHLQDSVQHMLSSLVDISAPIIVHLVDPQERLCAYIDLALENIASRHWGTRCRRVMLADSAPLLAALGLSALEEPCLLCVKENALVECVNLRRHFDTGARE